MFLSLRTVKHSETVSLASVHFVHYVWYIVIVTVQVELLLLYFFAHFLR